jgi:hypothetical protein
MRDVCMKETARTPESSRFSAVCTVVWRGVRWLHHGLAWRWKPSAPSKESSATHTWFISGLGVEMWILTGCKQDFRHGVLSVSQIGPLEFMNY